MKPIATFFSINKFEGLQRIAWSLFLLTVCAIPLSIYITFGNGWNLMAPLEPLIGLQAIILAVLVFSGKRLKVKVPDLAILSFCLSAIVSLAFATNFTIASKAAIVLIAYAVVFYGTPRLLQFGLKEWRIIIRVFTAAYTILLIYSLFHYFELGIHRQTSYLMSEPFNNGHTILIAIGFPVYILAMHTLFSKRVWMPNFPFVVLYSMVILLSFSRFYWVVMCFTVLVFILFHFGKLRPYLLAGLVLLSFAMADAYQHISKKRDFERTWDNPDDHNSVFVQLQSIFIMNKNDSNIERMNRWKAAWEIFLDNPVSGTGLNCFPEEYFVYSRQMQLDQTNLSDNRMNTHNLYLGWLSELGIIGFLAGCWILFCFGVSVWKLRLSNWLLFATLVMFNFLALGMIEDFILLEKIIPCFWMAFACIIFLSAEANHSILENRK